MHYKHIYFDLDRTIWDFETNSKQTFRDIFNKYELIDHFKCFDTFMSTYRRHNEKLWKEYREGEISKDTLRWKRFELTLAEFGIQSNEMAEKIGDDYISMSPNKKALFPYTHETLAYLKEKYELHIITNGFKEVQYIKLENSDLTKYFSTIITSEEAGAQKPKPEIFKHALETANAEKNECLMIGDDIETDIKGALNFGIDQVLFNPNNNKHNFEPTYEINSLNELKTIL